jgi:hypothetical protein
MINRLGKSPSTHPARLAYDKPTGSTTRVWDANYALSLLKHLLLQLSKSWPVLLLNKLRLPSLLGLEVGYTTCSTWKEVEDLNILHQSLAADKRHNSESHGFT